MKNSKHITFNFTVTSILHYMIDDESIIIIILYTSVF